MNIILQLKATHNLKLFSDVLYVFKIDQNLLSLAYFLKKKCYKMLFKRRSCVIKDQNTKEGHRKLLPVDSTKLPVAAGRKEQKNNFNINFLNKSKIIL